MAAVVESSCDKIDQYGSVSRKPEDEEIQENVTLIQPKTGDWLGSLKKVVFVLGSGLLLFVAARNTITWHVTRTWGASGDLWQRAYDTAYYWMGNNDFNMSVYGTFIVVNVTFWVGNALFIFMDVTGRLRCLDKYKIDPTVNRPLNMPKFYKAVRQVLFNQVIVGFPYIVLLYYISVLRGAPICGPLPTFHWVVFELVVYNLFEEFGFYYTHRLSHHPRLYKHIHKIHHEWPASISIISIYCHPIEHVVSNLSPLMIGPLVMGSHLATTWLWLILATLNTTVSHSGYHLPFLTSPEAHDFHHMKFTQNFGTLGVLDRLHGTDEMFRASREYQRHIMLLNLTSARELYPDTKKSEGKMASKSL